MTEETVEPTVEEKPLSEMDKLDLAATDKVTEEFRKYCINVLASKKEKIADMQLTLNKAIEKYRSITQESLWEDYISSRSDYSRPSR